ncbi:BTB/POZ domain-containing protein POB1 [Linum perenne]
MMTESELSPVTRAAASASASGALGATWLDVSFAFENPIFSDRILNIEILPDFDLLETHGNDFIDLTGDDSGSNVLRIKSLGISSLLLAARSPFFYKLICDQVKESDAPGSHLTLRIHEYEEEGLLELIKFMYSGSVSATTQSSSSLLFKVLVEADKFLVDSYITYLAQLLPTLTMTIATELVCSCLELPYAVLVGQAFQSLVDAAKPLVPNRYNNHVHKSYEVLLDMPLAIIDAVFSSDDLVIDFEDAVFDFLLVWAHRHYPTLEERKEIVSTQLTRLVRFPFLTDIKLGKVLKCEDIDGEVAIKVVGDASSYKLSEKKKNPVKERRYTFTDVYASGFEHGCLVYLELKREECSELFSSCHRQLRSKSFYFEDFEFYLRVKCVEEDRFGVYLGMEKKNPLARIVAKLEIGVRKNGGGNCSSSNFVSLYEEERTIAGEEYLGCDNLLGVASTTFMADQSPFFIDDTLCLEIMVTVRPLIDITM